MPFKTEFLFGLTLSPEANFMSLGRINPIAQYHRLLIEIGLVLALYSFVAPLLMIFFDYSSLMPERAGF